MDLISTARPILFCRFRQQAIDEVSEGQKDLTWSMSDMRMMVAGRVRNIRRLG